jgi:hypothetical protein
MNDDYYRSCSLLLFFGRPFSEQSPSKENIESSCRHFLAAADGGWNITAVTTEQIDSSQYPGLNVSSLDGNPMQQLSSAFEKAFGSSRKVVAVDALNHSISKEHLTEAFHALKVIECCIGHTNDAFFLLGLNAFEPELFAAPDGLLKLRSVLAFTGSHKKALYKVRRLT